MDGIHIFSPNQTECDPSLIRRDDDRQSRLLQISYRLPRPHNPPDTRSVPEVLATPWRLEQYTVTIEHDGTKRPRTPAEKALGRGMNDGVMHVLDQHVVVARHDENDIRECRDVATIKS